MAGVNKRSLKFIVASSTVAITNALDNRKTA
jgi:hypothetical protein